MCGSFSNVSHSISGERESFTRRCFNKSILLFQLHETYCSICKKRQVSQISQEDCLSLCNLLESRGIISMKRAKETRMAKVGKFSVLNAYVLFINPKNTHDDSLVIWLVQTPLINHQFH